MSNKQVIQKIEKKLLGLVETIFFDEWIPSVFTKQQLNIKNQFSKESSLFLHHLVMEILHIKFYESTKKTKSLLNFLQKEKTLKIPNYNNCRLKFGLEPLKNFTELTKDKEILSMLKKKYSKQGGIEQLEITTGIYLESFTNPKDTLTRILLMLPYQRFSKKSKNSSVKNFKTKLFDYKSIEQHSTNPFDETPGVYQKSFLFHPRFKIYWKYNSTHVDLEVQAIGKSSKKKKIKFFSKSNWMDWNWI